MHTNTRATDRSGFSLVELVVVIFVLAAIAGLLLPALARRREESRRIRCRNNLSQLYRGMWKYIGEDTDNRFFPCPLGRGKDPNSYSGAEWLATLYWTDCWGELVLEPTVFICPSTTDTNHDGADLGTHQAMAGRFGPRTVSYAGMHYYSQTNKAGQPEAGGIRDDYPPNKPMASDDTQGDINHGTADNGGMNILFFDSHVEFRTNEELDLEHAVGDRSPGALLSELAN